MSLPLKIKQFTANDIVSNCLWMLGGGAGRTVVTLGSNLVLVWYLLPEEFGRFALTQSIIELVAGITSLKISDIIIRESSHELEAGGKDTLFSALVIESLILGLGAWGLLWLVGLWDVWAGVLLLGTMAIHWGMVEFAYYERRFHYKNLTLLESGSHLVSHVLVSAGVVLGVGYPVLYVRMLLEAIGRLSSLFFVGGMTTFRLRWLRSHDWKSLYCKFRGLWLDGWLEHFFERLVILMVGWMAGEKAAGYFFQARRLAVVPHSLIAPVTERVAYNYFSHRVASDSGMYRLVRILAVQAVFLGVVGIAVFFLAGLLIPMLFGLQWEPVVPLLQAMVGMILGFSSFRTLKAFFMARKKMRPFVLLGRGIQYAVLAGAVFVILMYHAPAAFTLAFSVSAGYVIGSLVLFASCRKFTL